MKTRALLFTLCLAFAAACSNDGGTESKDAGTDATPEPTCFENPTIHAEIINACTTAQKVTKKPTLPLVNQDGSLPALPP